MPSRPPPPPPPLRQPQGVASAGAGEDTEGGSATKQGQDAGQEDGEQGEGEAAERDGEQQDGSDADAAEAEAVADAAAAGDKKEEDEEEEEEEEVVVADPTHVVNGEGIPAWDSEAVLLWLRRLGLAEAHVAKFADWGVDGATLLELEEVRAECAPTPQTHTQTQTHTHTHTGTRVPHAVGRVLPCRGLPEERVCVLVAPPAGARSCNGR